MRKDLDRVIKLEELIKKREIDDIAEVLEIDQETYNKIFAETIGKIVEATIKPTKTEAAYLLLRYIGLEEDEITVERLLKMLSMYQHILDLYDIIVTQVIGSCTAPRAAIPVIAEKIASSLSSCDKEIMFQ